MGNTPLMLATILKQKEVIKILCNHGTDPYFKPLPNSNLLKNYSIIASTICNC